MGFLVAAAETRTGTPVSQKQILSLSEGVLPIS